MNQSQTRVRVENPARWAKAAERAIAEGIQVRQLQGSGQWVASSGGDATVAYELDVTGAVAHGCACLAGLNNDPICKHKAAFFILVGAIDPHPEPTPPAPAVRCWRCFGDGECWVRGELVACPICGGNGRLPAPIAA
jgi:hypothetical protein